MTEEEEDRPLPKPPVTEAKSLVKSETGQAVVPSSKSGGWVKHITDYAWSFSRGGVGFDRLVGLV